MRAVWLWMLLAGAVQAAGPLAGLGHLPIAVRNLDAASADYRALGFTLKPGHLHEDSVSNNHAKFADGTELELITASEPRDEVATQYLHLLSGGEGPAFLALQWSDADRVRAALTRAGIGFRQGAFFTLEDPRLDYLFFGGDNHSPTDRPEYFAHANGADRLIGVWIADAENPALLALLRALGAQFDARHSEARLSNGTITLLPRSRRLLADRPLIGAVLRARDLGPVAAAARKAGIADVRSIAESGYHSLILPPSATHGLWLEFRQVDAAANQEHAR